MLTRQRVPTLDRMRYAPANGLRQGAYILADAPDGQPVAAVASANSLPGSALYPVKIGLEEA